MCIRDSLKRLDYRMTWEDAFRAYLLELDAKKPVILCGDLNLSLIHISCFITLPNTSPPFLCVVTKTGEMCLAK